ncbi:TIGR02466 family protein [Candidatus Pelagibacter sp. HIMB1715]|uniref:TIGR02466 family protein n=1 Tax=Candidatus Pelagibacter sp. HIMB1715 TaxID=3413369 RepID=UPI003F84CE93
MTQNEILKLFPEPIFKYKVDNYEEFNKDLKTYIYKLYENDSRGIERSNRGGWHSTHFRINEINSIQNRFAQHMQKYIINSFQNMGWRVKDKNIRIKEMWAIINKRNDFNVIHTHPNCYLSSAYYVKAPKNCGKFIVENPNIAKRHSFPEITNKNELNGDIAGIEISEGDLILFPSYLPHKVGKNESDDERIVISFNVDIKN